MDTGFFIVQYKTLDIEEEKNAIKFVFRFRHILSWIAMILPQIILLGLLFYSAAKISRTVLAIAADDYKYLYCELIVMYVILKLVISMIGVRKQLEYFRDYLPKIHQIVSDGTFTP